jgi:Uma2 family endonuclease
MTVATDSVRLTMDQFLSLPDGVRSELVGGVLTEKKTMGALADHIAIQIATRLNLFAAETGVGYVFGSETTYRCFGDPDTGRRADVSFVTKSKLGGGPIPEGILEVAADVAVEVVSPYDTAYEVETKVELYLKHGFGEVWVVYPITRSVNVHRPGQPIEHLSGDAVLHGRGPLDGFSTPVSAFFPAAQ